MGARGPVPNRTEDLARDRSRKGGDVQPVTKGVRRPVTWPAADPNWHEIATMVWDGAQNSGQADFYQQSDIAMLYSLCEELSNYKNANRRSGQMFQAIMSAMTELILTEGARRRVRVELDSAPEEPPDFRLIALSDYRDIDE